MSVCSKRMLRMAGQSAADLVGQSMRILHPEYITSSFLMEVVYAVQSSGS